MSQEAPNAFPESERGVESSPRELHSEPPARAVAPVAAPVAKPSKLGRLGGFFWRGAELRAAKAELAGKSAEQTRLERHAMAALELGRRALEPVDPLRAGRGDLLASLLFAESIRASLAASGKDLDALGTTAQLVARPSRVDDVGLDAEKQRSDARTLESVAKELIEQLRAPERRAHKALVQRFVRIFLVLALLSGTVVFGVMLAIRLSLGPDLAEGKAWRASSAYGGFSPAKGECDGRKTRIFFHTNEEDSPWLEYDLGSETTIQRVDVINRRDCCTDRAYPLAIEGSVDGKEWRELARRNSPFAHWTAKFAPASVRYVRVKALKRTFLHLREVEIR